MNDDLLFGRWLRRRRSGLGLTQEELARRVGYSGVTIRKVEADELRPSGQMAAKLADQLEIAPADRAQFIRFARGERGGDELALPTQTAILVPTEHAALPTGTVTWLFSDIESSTTLWEQHPQAMRGALARHDAIMHSAITAYNGMVFKTVGDSVYAVFDRAADALAATLAAQRALQAEVWGAIGSLQVRMALHSGTAEARDDDYFGPPLNRVARLLAAGHGGQILLSGATKELVRDTLPKGTELRDLGEHRLKDLDVPERIFQLVVPDLPVDFPALKTLDTFRTNLPIPATALIGREREVADVRGHLGRSNTRLLTLTGPGGVGKTRLALEVAAEVEHAFADGVGYVTLAPIRDPQLVAPAIAQALGIRELPTQAGPVQPLRERLMDYLRAKRLLLLLDNFEQILDAAPLVAELLAASPGLRVLVTSRAPLRLRGEQEVPVPPLALPPALPIAKPTASGKLNGERTAVPSAAVRSWEELARYAAIQLFVERAGEVQPDFQLTEANAESVAATCARLDGLPLAIELAAVRCRLFAPDALLALLDNRLALLRGGPRDVPARQQTLRAEIGWSYELLDAAEQQLFRRLSVFAGGWRLEAAEAVVGWNVPTFEHWNILDGLAALVEQSLVQRGHGPDSVPRFTMLETIREYALEQLELSGEVDTIRRRHAAHYLALAEAAEPELRGPQQDVWLERLETDHDNLRAALAWCLRAQDEQREPVVSGADTQNMMESRAVLGLRLAGTLWLFWYYRGQADEGCAWLNRALSAVVAQPTAPANSEQQVGSSYHTYRIRALYGATLLSFLPGDWITSRRCLEEIIRTTLRGDRMHALALMLLANLFYEDGNPALAQSYCEEGLALLAVESEDWDRAWALTWLANGLQLHDSRAGILFNQESVALFRKLGDRFALTLAIGRLGNLAYMRGDFARASACLEESLELSHAMRNYRQYAHNLRVLGRLAAEQSDFPRGAMLAEQALAHFQTLGLRSDVNNTLTFLGYIAWACGNYDEASKRLQGSLALASELPRKELSLWARNWLGWIACARGNDDQETLFQENVASAGDRHFSILVAWSLQGLGYFAYRRGETDQAVELLSEGLATLEQTGWTIARAFMLSNLARAVQAQGDLVRAAELWRESLALSRDLGDRWKIAIALEGLASLAAMRRQPEWAARLYGAAEALREAIGTPLWPSLRAAYDQSVAAARSHLGAAAFDAAWATGRALPLDAVIDAALDAGDEPDTATMGVAPSGPRHAYSGEQRS